MCAANSFGNSVHWLAPLGTVGCSKRVSHTLTPGAVETPVILEFVRERVRFLTLKSQLQRHAALATDFAKTDAVRLSGRIYERCVAWRWIAKCLRFDWCAGVHPDWCPRI